MFTLQPGNQFVESNVIDQSLNVLHMGNSHNKVVNDTVHLTDYVWFCSLI